MKVERIHLDGDLGVVNAARVSFGRWKNELDDSDLKLIEYLKKHNHKSPFYHPQIVGIADKQLDLYKLGKLNLAGLEWYCADAIVYRMSVYLYNELFDLREINRINFGFMDELSFNRIYSDDELSLIKDDQKLFRISRMPYLQFRIKAPIFVVRQLEKHVQGMVKNERSGRYVKFDCEFWEPKRDIDGCFLWRKSSKNNKQGSKKDEFIDEKGVDNEDCENIFREYLWYDDIIKDYAINWYNLNTANGMCAEQARAILPLATYTEFVWTGSLQDYARICSLRLKDNAQIECQEVVQMIYDLCKQEYPNVFDRLVSLH